LSNFPKEFYHWLAVSDNEAQRVRVWLVACYSTKVSKQITDRKYQRSFRKSAVTKQLIIHVVSPSYFF